jgi:hypothetical protein
MTLRNLLKTDNLSSDNLRLDSKPGSLGARTLQDPSVYEHIAHDYFQNVQQLSNGFVLTWCQDEVPRTLLFLPRQKPCTFLTQYDVTKYPEEWEVLRSTQVSDKWRVEDGNLYPVIRGIETIVLFD